MHRKEVLLNSFRICLGAGKYMTMLYAWGPIALRRSLEVEVPHRSCDVAYIHFQMTGYPMT